MQELIRTRCKQGWLIITDEFVRIELPGGIKSFALFRSTMTGVDSEVAIFPMFGLGGGTNLTFHGAGGEVLHADLVKPKVAQEIVGMLQHPS